MLKDNTTQRLEAKILEHYNKVASLGDKRKIAIILHQFILHEKDCFKGHHNNNTVGDLDLALRKFYGRKECIYAMELLEHFIETGNLDLAETPTESISTSVRWKEIKNCLKELLMSPVGTSVNSGISAHTS